MQLKLKETIGFISKKTAFKPEIMLILGSGFGSVAKGIDIESNFPFQEIPYFQKTSVQTHQGRLILGRFHKKKVMVMQGRYHIYEGFSASEVAYPVMVAAELGAKILISTNLAGGINRKLKVGDFMIIKDHLNFSYDNPLRGLKNTKGEISFVDMHAAYSPHLIRLVKRAAERLKIKLHAGALAYLSGPNFETPAEVAFLRKTGVDAVGWSIVPEVLMARYLGMDVLGISCISDITDAHSRVSLNIKEIFAVGLKKAEQLHTLLSGFLGLL